MRILITGAGGFVGKELVNFLSSQDPSLQIRAVIRGDCPKPLCSVEYVNIANISSQTSGHRYCCSFGRKGSYYERWG